MLELTGISIPLDAGGDEAACVAAARRALARAAHLRAADIERIELRRRSIDARRRGGVRFTLGVRVRLRTGIDEARLLRRMDARTRKRARLVEERRYSFPAPISRRTESRRPVVVGAGCAGLFAALALAQAGLEPLVIERGDDARDRTRAIARFRAGGALDSESNIQFGLGGAGTFSDGKLSTGTTNPAHLLILKTLVASGAPDAILWDARPHIGSDVLPGVVERIAGRIRDLGGEVRYRSRLTDIEHGTVNAGAISSIAVDTGAGEERIACDRVILACGHSARDVFELLRDRGFRLQRKTFAVGVRIEHAQRDIDRALYGDAAGHPALGAAPYRLVAHLGPDRSLFSFCMCPGGEVVAATSEEGCVVTNGASDAARGGRNANAALLSNIAPADLPGDGALAGVDLQRRCERAAFELGGGAYRAPAQLVGDFLAGVPSERAGRISPTYPLGVTWGALDDALPAAIVEALRAGLPALDRRLHGFTAADAVLTGVETRSSSPVRVERDQACQATGAPGLFPCGEGAGYAGGIMSAAADGIRCAEALIASMLPHAP